MTGAAAASTRSAAAAEPQATSLQRPAVYAVSALVLGSGLLNIYSVVGRGVQGRVEWLRHFLPLEAVHLSRSAVLFTGFALVLASVNILRRKRRAWLLTTALAAASTVFHIVKGLDYEEAALSLLLLAALWSLRHSFTVRSRDIDWPSGLWKTAAVAALAVLYGMAGFWVLETREFGRDFNWHQSLDHTVALLLFSGDAGLQPRTRYAEWFIDSLDLITAGTLMYAGWSLFRPVLYRFRTHPEQQQQARRIVERWGRSSQDFFKFSTDKSWFFSADRSAFLAYRVAAGFAVVLGDPVGPPEQLLPLVRAFLDYCSGNGWRAAFHQATPECLPVYEAAALRRLKVGDDAVVDLERFTLKGRHAKALRSKLNQFERIGLVARWYDPPVPDAVVTAAEQVSREWLKLPGRRERQFTLGWFDPDYVRSTPVLAAEDAFGRMQGFLNLIPSWRPGEATVDLMRRRGDGPNGVIDFLFLHAFLAARERGMKTFNLGMAPMSGFRPGEDATAEERAIHAFFQRLQFVFSFEGLKSWKARFATSWEPRYVVYRSAFDLPLLPLALGRVSESRTEE